MVTIIFFCVLINCAVILTVLFPIYWRNNIKEDNRKEKIIKIVSKAVVSIEKKYIEALKEIKELKNLPPIPDIISSTRDITGVTVQIPINVHERKLMEKDNFKNMVEYKLKHELAEHIFPLCKIDIIEQENYYSISDSILYVATIYVVQPPHKERIKL
jgi:hypothetical protein